MTYDNKSYRVVAPATQSLYKRDTDTSTLCLAEGISHLLNLCSSDIMNHAMFDRG